MNGHRVSSSSRGLFHPRAGPRRKGAVLWALFPLPGRRGGEERHRCCLALLAFVRLRLLELAIASLLTLCHVGLPVVGCAQRCSVGLCTSPMIERGIDDAQSIAMP